MKKNPKRTLFEIEWELKKAIKKRRKNRRTLKKLTVKCKEIGRKENSKLKCFFFFYLRMLMEFDKVWFKFFL